MPSVTFTKSGVTADWDDSVNSLLELGEAKGLELPFGCRQGKCTKCQQPLVDGKIDYPNGHVGQPDEGNILLCCSVPTSDVKIDA